MLSGEKAQPLRLRLSGITKSSLLQDGVKEPRLRSEFEFQVSLTSCVRVEQVTRPLQAWVSTCVKYEQWCFTVQTVLIYYTESR